MKKKNLIFAIAILSSLFTACTYLGPCVSGSGPMVSEIREVTGFSGVVNTTSFDVYVSEADSFGVEIRAQGNLIPLIETFTSGSVLYVESKNTTCFRSSNPIEVHVSLPVLERVRNSGSGSLVADILSSEFDGDIANSGSGELQVDSIYAPFVLIENSGSGRIITEYIDAAVLDIRQSGSGSISGGSFINNTDLEIRHSSSGRVSGELMMGDEVRISMSGSGSVMIEGEAGTGDFRLSSSGKVDVLDLRLKEAFAQNTGSGRIYTWVMDVLRAEITGSGDILYRGDPEIYFQDSGSGSLIKYD